MILGVARSAPNAHRTLGVPEGAVDSTPRMFAAWTLFDPPPSVLDLIEGSVNVLIGVAVASHLF